MDTPKTIFILKPLNRYLQNCRISKIIVTGQSYSILEYLFTTHYVVKAYVSTVIEKDYLTFAVIYNIDQLFCLLSLV